MTTLTSYQKKALRLDKHIALTANAGSGKTFVLAQRFLKIILDKKISVKKIVAITFTDKAAGELYNKISKQIEVELISETDKSRRNRLKFVREQLVSANISTIHSFCLNVLKEFSPEANLDASFVPIDKETSNEILDLSIEESFNEMVNSDQYSEQIKSAIRIVGSKSNLLKQIKRLVNKRRSFNKMKRIFLEESVDTIQKIHEQLFDKYYSSIFIIDESVLLSRIKDFNDQVKSENPKNDFSDQINELLIRLEENQLTKIGRIKSYSELFTAMLKSDKNIKQRGYASKDLISSNEELNEILNEQANIILKFDLENSEDILRNYAEFVKSFSVVLEYVNRKYASLKKEKSYIDFEDILIFTEHVLEKEDVINKLREKYNYIMIDEFQDTNEIQLNIFLPVLENLKKGNLFVVGDEKQSIYMFRDAEISIFNDTKEMISQMDGEENLLNLPHSFRLSKELAFFTNYLFSRLFSNHNSSFNEVKYNSLVYFEKEENTESKIEVIISDQTKDEYFTQAELICSKIIDLITEGKVDLSQIAILCRRRSDFQILEKEFVKQNIPYSIMGGRGFYQRQLVLDLFNYLSFLINQNNDASLVAILRSPFYSFSDSEIFSISFYDGINFYEKLKKASVDFPKLLKAYDTLNDHIKGVSQNRLSDLLRKIFNDSAYLSIIVKRINSRQELANIEKLFEVAQTYMNQGFRSIYDFVNYLNESIQLTEDEGQAEISASENSVKIMTVHQSKGLEFDAVFLFNLSSLFNLTSIKSKEIDFDKEFGFITKVPKKTLFDEYLSPYSVTLYGHLNKRKEIAEQKRLLYVAVTRAAKYLFLCYDEDGKLNENTFSGLLKKVIPNLVSISPTLLSGTLRRMYKNGDEFKEDEIVISTEINIYKEVAGKKFNPTKLAEGKTKFKISAANILDNSKGEVLTASQFALFLQCPVKYQLIYELGTNEISEILPRKHKKDFIETESAGSGTEKGTIVHHILSINYSGNELEKYLQNKFKADVAVIKESIELVNSFYNSSIHKGIASIGYHFNEYEVYSEFDNFYLHGYIDKLIINNHNAIIIDYKTDNVNSENLTDKISYYSNQLLFYAKMIFAKFVEINEIEIKLVFLKDLNKSHSKKILRNEIEIKQTEENLRNFISSIRERSYKFNKLSCTNCQFYFNNNCIKEKSRENEKNFAN